MAKIWTNNTDEIISCLDEFLRWNNTRNNRNVVEQIKCFAINEALMTQVDQDLPFVTVLQGQTRFTNIEGDIGDAKLQTDICD